MSGGCKSSSVWGVLRAEPLQGLGPGPSVYSATVKAFIVFLTEKHR